MSNSSKLEPVYESALLRQYDYELKPFDVSHRAANLSSYLEFGNTEQSKDSALASVLTNPSTLLGRAQRLQDRCHSVNGGL
jgi:DNA-binding NtrC family response regulator